MYSRLRHGKLYVDLFMQLNDLSPMFFLAKFDGLHWLMNCYRGLTRSGN